MTDPRLQEAAALIEAVLHDVAAELTAGVPTETIYRLAMAHDAVTQADGMLQANG